MVPLIPAFRAPLPRHAAFRGGLDELDVVPQRAPSVRRGAGGPVGEAGAQVFVGDLDVQLVPFDP